jgi:hypothetical protein
MWPMFADFTTLVVVIGMSAIGAILIILYGSSTVGPHLRYISVGLFTACAAFLVGDLTGLVLGIPRIVSSGFYGYQASIAAVNRRPNQRPYGPGPADAEPAPAELTDEQNEVKERVPWSKTNGADASTRFVPSSNRKYSEIL